MSAASEAEATTLFTNMKEGVIQRIPLEEMLAPTPNTNHSRQFHSCGTCTGHHQGQQVPGHGLAPPLDTSRAQQHQFLVIWAPGKLNKADDFTKLHAPMRLVYLPSPPSNPAQLSLANLSCGGVLNPSFQSRAGHPDVTGIPLVNYSTSQRQLPSMHAEVSYLTKTPITTKPIVCTN